MVHGALAARLKDATRVSAVACMGYVFSSDDLKARVLRPRVSIVIRMAFGGAKSRLILQNPDGVALFKQAFIVGAEQVAFITGSGVDCQHLAHPSADALTLRTGRFQHARFVQVGRCLSVAQLPRGSAQGFDRGGHQRLPFDH